MPWLRPCPRPQKTFPYRKKQAGYADFAQSCRNYARNRKNSDYYQLFSQVLLHPKLGCLELKFGGFVQN